MIKVVLEFFAQNVALLTERIKMNAKSFTKLIY